MTTTAEKVAGILKHGLREAEYSKVGHPVDAATGPTRLFPGRERDYASAYGYLYGAVEAAVALLEAHVTSEAYEDQVALRDDDRAKLRQGEI